MSTPKFLPIYNINIPNGGAQVQMTVSADDKIYSSYTGEHVWTGPMPNNIKTDAPITHPNYGKTFHVIEYNPANGSHMVHGFKKSS